MLNNRSIPFRYPGKIDKHFKVITKLNPKHMSKNKALKYALCFTASCIKNLEKLHPKMEQWDLITQMEKIAGPLSMKIDFHPEENVA